MQPLEYYPATQNENTGYVYFFAASNGLTKIGMAISVMARYAEISAMSPLPLTVAYCQVVTQPRYVERALHNHFAAYRRHGEWFEFSPERLEEAKRLLENPDSLRLKYAKIPAQGTNKRTVRYRGLLLSGRAAHTLEHILKGETFLTCKSLEDVAQLKDKHFAVIKDCGSRTTAEIRDALATAGYAVRAG